MCDTWLSRQILVLLSLFVLNLTMINLESDFARIASPSLLLSKVTFYFYFLLLTIVITAFTQEQLKAFLAEGKVEILGHILTTDDVKVCLYILK